MSPMRISGVGLAPVISFAMDQIFCLAPSMRPVIEPVVSSTKQTSILGFSFVCGSLANAVGGKSQTPNPKHQRNPNIQIPNPLATALPWSLRFRASRESRQPRLNSPGAGADLELEF